MTRLGAALLCAALGAVMPVAGLTAGFDPVPWSVGGAVVGAVVGWTLSRGGAPGARP